MLLNLAIICDMFVPLFIQNLHGQSPLIAGYTVALVAVGWSSGSVVTSSWAGSKAQAVIVIGPVLQAIAIAGLACSSAATSNRRRLAAAGAGRRVAGAARNRYRHFLAAHLGPPAAIGPGGRGRPDLGLRSRWCSSSPPSLGAAVAGVIVNGAGLAGSEDVAATVSASNWLYGLFALVPLLTIPIAWRIVRGERVIVATAVEPAE